MDQSLRSGKHIVWNTDQRTSCALAPEGEGVAGGDLSLSAQMLTPHTPTHRGTRLVVWEMS